MCFAEGYGYKRALILTALDAGYFNDEYVYIMADPNSNGFCELFSIVFSEKMSNFNFTKIVSWEFSSIFIQKKLFKKFKK